MERESDNRTALRRALQARILCSLSPPLPEESLPSVPSWPSSTPTRHDPDAETVAHLLQRAMERLDGAIGILTCEQQPLPQQQRQWQRDDGDDAGGADDNGNVGSTRLRRQRAALDYVCLLEHGAGMPSADCDRDPFQIPSGRLRDVRALYGAFWRAIAAAPFVVPIYGTALGDPPTPHTVADWLRAHFGDEATGAMADTPFACAHQCASAAGDTIEALWHRATIAHRVPDVWATRRTALWQRGACAPEVLFVLAVADDVSTAPGSHPLLTRTVVLYARADGGDGPPLRVVCHASSVLALIDGAVDSHAESDAEARIFVAADARMLLGPLSVPSAVEWGTMDAVCRWVASIADNGASLAVAPISWLLATPPPSQSRLSTVLLRGRLLADKVRGAIVSVPCRCCRRQPPSTVPESTREARTPLRTAQGASEAALRATRSLADSIHARGRRLIGPVRAVALDACLLDVLLVDFWHRWRSSRGVSPFRSSVVAA